MQFFGNPVQIEESIVKNPAQRVKKTAGMEVSYGHGETRFGQALFFETGHKLCGLTFPEKGDEDHALEKMKQLFPKASFKKDDSLASRYAPYLFDPQKIKKTLALFLMGTEFQLRVWKSLLKVFPKATSSYKKIAEDVASHPRPVGGAIGENPISWVVPCHRILGTDGSMTGYRWGIAQKQSMLAYEKNLSYP